MKKIIYNTLIILYALIAIIVTICLLSFNQYKVSEFDSTTVLIINTNNLKEKGFNKGDLVLVDTTQKQEPGEDIFFHATSELGETTYVLENKEIPSDLAIGPTKNSTRIGKLGTILSILESKWGFLILIVFPSLLAFLYELWEFIANVRAAKDEEEEEEEDENEEEVEEVVVEKKKPAKKTTTTTAKKTTRATKATTTKATTTKKSNTAKKTSTSKPKATTTKATTTKSRTTKAKEQ